MEKQSDLLIRLMDKVDQIKSDQDTYISFSRVKLESIESQAKTTNGQVARNLKAISDLGKEITIGDKETFFKTLKIVAMMLVGSMFIAVKESRDVVILILQKLFL